MKNKTLILFFLSFIFATNVFSSVKMQVKSINNSDPLICETSYDFTITCSDGTVIVIGHSVVSYYCESGEYVGMTFQSTNSSCGPGSPENPNP